ncbi:DNA glycosylase [Haematococcus lacustris]
MLGYPSLEALRSPAAAAAAAGGEAGAAGGGRVGVRKRAATRAASASASGPTPLTALDPLLGEASGSLSEPGLQGRGLRSSRRRRTATSPQPAPSARAGAEAAGDEGRRAGLAGQQAGQAVQQEGAEAGGAAGVQAGGVQEAHLFFAFPTLQQLAQATEQELRGAGFGYRARFIVGSVAALQAKPEGGQAWLLGLRQVSLQEALAQLSGLPGVGPKVAACVCLFSLDKHEAIPVDTHVWQIATRHYLPELKGVSLTPKLHPVIQAAFTQRFGAYAGWAHNALFISELASQQHRLPPTLRARKK